MKTHTHADHRGGMNTKLAPYLLSGREAALLQNWWLDARGQLEIRPGYTKLCSAETSPPANPITGAHVYYYSTGGVDSATTIYWRNGRAYREDGCAGVVQSICSGYSTSLHMNMANAENKLHGVNGSGSFVLEGTTVTTALGLTAPASAPTVALGAAGALTGAYLYKVTAEYGTRGESNPSTASASVSPSAQKVDLTAIPTPTGATKRHIYRTVASGTTYYFVATLSDNTTTTYTDNTIDSALGDELEDDHDAPPTAKYITPHQGAMFYSGNPSAPKRLYFSIQGFPEIVPATTHYIDVPVAGSNITGHASLEDCLVVFTDTAYFVLYGTTVSTYRFKLIEPSIGCTAPKSIATYSNGAYFEYHSQVFRCFGGPPQLISDDIDNDWACPVAANARESVGIIWRGKYLLSRFVGNVAYASKNGDAEDTAANNRVYLLDIKLLDQAEEGRSSAWFKWTNIFPNVWVVKNGPAVNQELLYWGTNRSTGLMYQMSEGGTGGAFTDDGTAITVRYESAAHPEGDPKLVKRWRLLWTIFRAASALTVTAQFKIDQAAAWTSLTAKSLAATRGQLATARWRFPEQTQGCYGQLAFEISSSVYLLMHAYSVEAFPLRNLGG